MMIATKKSYEAPNVQLIQFDGNDVIATSGENWWFDCAQNMKGNYRDSHCDIDFTSDNSTDT